MTFMIKRDASIYYELSGPGSKPETVVLLHGLGLSHINWIDHLQGLHAAGYQVLNVDLRGHGKSVSNKANQEASKHESIIKQATQDLYDICERQGLNRLILVGYSTGTLVCLNFALTYPELVSGIAISGAFSEVSNLFLWGKFRGAQLLSYKPFRPILEKEVARSNGRDKEQIALFKKEAKKVQHAEGVRWIQDSIKFNCSNELHKLTCPVLVLYGGNERRMMKYRRIFLDKIPNVQICLIPNVNHATLTKAADKYAFVLTDFIQAISLNQ